MLKTFQKTMAYANYFMLIAIAFALPFHSYLFKLSSLAFVFWLLEGRYKEKLLSVTWKKNRIIVGVLISYLIYTFLSEYLHSGMKYGINASLKQFAILIYPLMFFAPNLLLKKTKNIRIILFSYVLGTLILSLYSIYLAKISYSPDSFLPIFTFQKISLTDTYLRFSIYVVWASAISCYLIYTSARKKLDIITFIISFIILTICIYIVGARSGIVAFVLTLIVMLFNIFKNFKQAKILKYICLVFIISISIFLANYSNNSFKIKTYNAPRVIIYTGAIDTVLDNLFTPKQFLLGLGKKQSQVKLGENIQRVAIERDSSMYKRGFDGHPHNDFFSIILKRGFLGLLFIIFLSTIILIKLKKEKNILALLFCLVFGIYVTLSGLFEDTHDTCLFYFFYCMLIFLEFNNLKLDDKSIKENFLSQ